VDRAAAEGSEGFVKTFTDLGQTAKDVTQALGKRVHFQHAVNEYSACAFQSLMMASVLIWLLHCLMYFHLQVPD
jgi:hypothetical protein